MPGRRQRRPSTVDDLVEAAVERALTQAADVRVLRDRAELASHGRIAAVLRF